MGERIMSEGMPVRGRSLDEWEHEHTRLQSADMTPSKAIKETFRILEESLMAALAPEPKSKEEKTVAQLAVELAPLVPKGHAVEIRAEGATITTPEGQTLPLEEWVTARNAADSQGK
jgi:hypothetical protein